MKKILLSSDCNGNLQLLFSKVSQLSQKTKFDIMFLTGNVLPLQATKQFSLICKGLISVPIPIYFITTGPMSKVLDLAYPQGHELAKNFVFLGRKGLRVIQGLTVCWMDGVANSGQRKDGQYKGGVYDVNDVRDIVKQCQNMHVDILLTNEWPQQIAVNYRTTVLLQTPQLSLKQSHLVSLLSYKLTPKYHLAASGKSFYRMQPYKSTKQSTYTHFINIAEMNKNGLKDKYLLAVQTVALEKATEKEVITNSVDCPFDGAMYEKEIEQLMKGETLKEGNTVFVDDQRQMGFKDSLKLKQGNTTKHSQQSSNFITEQTYVYFDSVPSQAHSDDIHEFLQRWGKVTKLQIFKQHKGGMKSGLVKFSSIQQTKQCLADTGKFSLYQSRIKFKPKQVEQKYRHQDCWFCEKNQKFDRSLLVYKGKYCMICLDKGPVTEWHLQVVPVNHVDTIGKLERVEVDEIQHVVKQLKQYFMNKGYETIITERHMKLSQQISHTLIQFIAISTTKGLIHRFHQLNQQQRMHFNPADQEYKRKSQFFIKLQINNQTFMKQIYPKEKVEFEFVRKVVCELINQPSKINWRACERTPQALNKFRKDVGEVLAECHLVGALI